MMRRAVIVGLSITAVSAAPGRASEAQTCAANVPHMTGTWKTLASPMPIDPVSATLLHNGRVLIVAGSEYTASNNSAGSEAYRAGVWDPSTGSVTVQNLDYDVFCSGTAVLPDGRPLIVGGTTLYSPPESAWGGDNRASIYNPAMDCFAQSQSMADGRWYATATTLGDGRVMAFSGTSSTSGVTNNTVEIYSLTDTGAGWTSPAAAPFNPPLYPRMMLLPNGSVFFTGQGNLPPTPDSWFFDPATEHWTASAPTTMDRTYDSAALLPLLPPNYRPVVMNFGGGLNPATNSTERIDLSAVAPSWSPGPSMSAARIAANAVLLPNGKVLVSGGSVNYEVPDQAGKAADIYDPVSNTFSSGGSASFSRLYHSTALLLPDATVASLGSNPAEGGYEPAIEIYTPAYLYDRSDRLLSSTRPTITGVSASVLGYNAPFSVSYASSAGIGAAVLMRPGSVTHFFDSDQRMIGLCGPPPQPACSSNGGTLNLTTPPNGNIAPPGYYMLFLLDAAGVPSVARFVQLTTHSTAPPAGAITTPGSDVTITVGEAVKFSTTTSAAQYSWVFPGGSPASSTAMSPGNVQFNTPGTYTASLTVLDSNGNSDPDPPVRTITVLPAAADFSLSTITAASVLPGQSASFPVTVTPVRGFAGTVNLGVSVYQGFPAGVSSGGFSPAAINGSGTSTLVMNTTAGAVPYAVTLTITGTSGALTHTTSSTLLVESAPPANVTAAAGNGQVQLSWLPVAGASGYTVNRGTTSGGPYVLVTCPSGAGYTDTGLVNGTTYYYVVNTLYAGGVNGGGGSAYSVEASAMPQGPGGVPTSTPLPATLTPTPTSALPTPTAAALSVCAGDCNGDRTISVDEIVTLVNIALGSDTVQACPAGDVNRDGRITVDEILAAVTNALNGCHAA